MKCDHCKEKIYREYLAVPNVFCSPQCRLAFFEKQEMEDSQLRRDIINRLESGGVLEPEQAAERIITEADYDKRKANRLADKFICVANE